MKLLGLFITLIILYYQVIASKRNSPIGVTFNFVKKILLAESYARIQFLIPFPKEPALYNNSYQKAAEKVADLWDGPKARSGRRDSENAEGAKQHSQGTSGTF